MEIAPELQAAVRERIQLGQERTTILQELREAGYSVAEAEAIYTAVASERGVSDGEAGAPPAPAAPDTSASYESAAPAAAPTFFSRHPFLAVGSIVLLLSIGGVVAASAWLDMSGWRSYISFLGSAPYDEVTLLPGIIDDLSDTTTASVDSRFRVAWEPRSDVAHEAFLDMFLALDSLGEFIGGIPDEAYAESRVLTRLDARDEDDIRSHVEGSLEINFDIMQLEMAGSVRQIDTTVYGRIDEFPAMLNAELGDVPTNTWIELFNEETLEDLDAVPRNVPTIPGMSWSNLFHNPALAQLTQPEWLTALQPVVASGQTHSQLAQAMNFPAVEEGEDTPDPFAELDEETREAATDAVIQAWKTAPLITFTEAPQRERIDGETVYVYNLMLNAVNLETYLNTLRTELEDHPDLVSQLPTARELPDAVMIDQFNELVDVVVTVRPDGSLHGMSVGSVITSPDKDFPNQINISLNARYEELGDDMRIDVPTEVHEKTLEELLGTQATLPAAQLDPYSTPEPTQVVATVNGVDILRSDYSRVERQFSHLLPDTQLIRERTMEMLINTELIRQAAVADGITVSEAEVDQRFTELVDQIGGSEALAQELQREGLTEETFRQNIEQEFLLERYLDRELTTEFTVTEAEIQSLYEQEGGAAELPPLDTIRDQVEEQLILQQEQAAISELTDGMRETAEIEIHI